MKSPLADDEWWTTPVAALLLLAAGQAFARHYPLTALVVGGVGFVLVAGAVFVLLVAFRR